MFEASVDGEPYDPDRWSQYFRPAGMSQATGDPNKTPAPAPKPVTTASEDVPFKSNEEAAAEAQVSPPPTAEPAASSSVDASDILAQIRKRQGA
jgi:hypothetical protein